MKKIDNNSIVFLLPLFSALCFCRLNIIFSWNSRLECRCFALCICLWFIFIDFFPLAFDKVDKMSSPMEKKCLNWKAIFNIWVLKCDFIFAPSYITPVFVTLFIHCANSIGNKSKERKKNSQRHGNMLRYLVHCLNDSPHFFGLKHFDRRFHKTFVSYHSTNWVKNCCVNFSPAFYSTVHIRLRWFWP